MLSLFIQTGPVKLILSIFALTAFWVLLRLPNIDAELGLKLDSAIASNSTYIYESWTNEPQKRLFAAVDNRFHLEKLETRAFHPYLHVPPLGVVPLGLITTQIGMKEWQIRSGCLLMSCLFLWASFALAYKLVGFKGAVGTAIVLALCPQSMHYSRNADPILISAFWAPLMALSYLYWCESKSKKAAFFFYGIAMVAMLSFWSHFGLFGLLVIHRVISERGAHFWKRLGYSSAWVATALGLILAYDVAVWGSWSAFVDDLTSSYSGRTSGLFSVFDLLRCDLRRYPQNYGLSLCIGVVLYLWFVFSRKEPSQESGHRCFFLLFLMLGSLLFPLYASTVSYVHDYYGMAFLLPAALMNIEVGKRLWQSKWRIGKVVLLSLCLLYLAQSFWVSRNRMVRYDKDNLLSRRLGQAYAKTVAPGILLTDASDLEYTIQYYSRAKVMVRCDDVETLKYCLDKAKLNAGESFVFLSITASQCLQEIPELQAYPYEKLTNEFSLKENMEDPLWTYLLNNFLSRKIGNFTLFDLTQPLLANEHK